MSNELSLEDMKDCLLNRKSNPIAQRTHVAFLLRTQGTEECALILAEALKIREDSALMRHELAYILGQMQYDVVCPLLESILLDETEDLIVRHESAEALGSIGCKSSVSILMKYCNHPAPEIHETCRIAVDLINWKEENRNEAVTANHIYLSKDPAPPVIDNLSINDLKDKLLDTGISLFDRYRAMFALRNKNSDDAAMALVEGFNDSSALFRHEIAYVLGQMHRNITTEALIEVLRNKTEHSMVRHEAAEALGAIGNDQAQSILSEFIHDEELVVKESCYVALNIIDYWSK